MSNNNILEVEEEEEEEEYDCSLAPATRHGDPGVVFGRGHQLRLDLHDLGLLEPLESEATHQPMTLSSSRKRGPKASWVTVLTARPSMCAHSGCVLALGNDAHFSTSSSTS
ncbi:hypothetical protein CRUP_002235 [Coryphaenoides rupestris]|nr:hypothetical protein CRUP_002235 [Coryphaenoides rupestris]